MKALQDKVAIVTGASSGIGRATAKLFAAEGAKVVVTARRKAELDAACRRRSTSGRRTTLFAVAGDIGDESAGEVPGRIPRRSRFGGLDIAFNNAGSTGEMGPVYGHVD